MDIDNLLMGAAEKNRTITLPLRNTRGGKDAFFSLFECERCGKCCTTTSKYIEFGERDFERAKKYLPKGGRSKFKKVGNKFRTALPCVFYSKQGCLIYDIRPEVCRNYPTGYVVEGYPDNLAVHATCPQACKVTKAIIEFATDNKHTTPVTRVVQKVGGGGRSE